MGYLQGFEKEVVSLDGVSLSISDQAEFYLDQDVENDNKKNLILHDLEGVSAQCDPDREKMSDSELTIGLDFGTSTTKVVVGDKQLKKSFAVPFRRGDGIETYLIPSRLYVTRGEYSLESGNAIFDDIKVMLLSNPDDLDCRIKVVAYWALVLRHVRGWLFYQHADMYRDKEIFWTISVGIPTVDKEDKSLIRLYEELMMCAWLYSIKNKTINRGGVRKTIEKLDAAKYGDFEPEIRVVSELAAQIYGFVVSNSFDEKAKNIYMMFDIGGGSLDSALFHVRPGRGDRWRFSYFNAQVEPLGALNLHRFRLGFWDRCLREYRAPKRLLQQLSRLSNNFEGGEVIPDAIEDYCKGITIEFKNNKSDPDWLFGKQALRQVKTDTLCSAVTTLHMLSREDVKNISFYACGGGSNMQFYRKHLIEEVSVPSQNSTWLYANEKPMPRPDNLQAEGVRSKDYDRLSVAYGLSQLELDGDKGLIWPEPLAVTDSQNFSKVETEYVSKDMV